MNDAASRRQPAAKIVRVEQIADLLDEVCAANGLLTDEADPVLWSGSVVSPRIIRPITRLADRLRPGAQARADLSDLDPRSVLAGTSLWMARHRTTEAIPASARAAARWSGQESA